MLPKQHRSWLLLAAWFGLSIVTSNAFPTDSVVEDLQNRAVLAPLFSRRNPIEARGDDIPECVPEMVEDNETVEGDGKDIYRSKKEDPDDPPDAPGEFPEKKDRAPVYSDDPEEDKEETQGDSGKTLRARARGSKLRDITVSVMKEGWKKPKKLRTSKAWTVMHPQKRHSYYRADEDGLIYLKVAKGDKAEIDKLDTKMEIDHNFEHQESINGIFGKDAPVPEGVPENWWRKYADQYTDDGENTPLKLAAARVINNPANANNIDGVINQMKGDLTTAVINKLNTGEYRGGPKYSSTRSRSTLLAAVVFLTAKRTQTMYENALKCFAETFEAHTKGDNPEYAEKCKKHIIKRGLEIRAHLIKKAKIDLKAEKPDSWDPKSKKYVQKPFMVEDVPNKKQWEGIDGSKIEDKKDDIEDVEEDRKDKKEDEKDKKEEEKEDIEDEQEDIEDEQEDEEEDEDDDDD